MKSYVLSLVLVMGAQTCVQTMMMHVKTLQTIMMHVKIVQTMMNVRIVQTMMMHVKIVQTMMMHVEIVQTMMMHWLAQQRQAAKQRADLHLFGTNSTSRQ